MIQNLEGESWRKLPPDYPGYSVSNLGRVVSYYGRQRGDGGRWSIMDTPQRLISPWIHEDCYCICTLRGTRSQRNFLVHRLVLCAFVGEAPEGYVAHHRNEIRTDNRVENLEWREKSICSWLAGVSKTTAYNLARATFRQRVNRAEQEVLVLRARLQKYIQKYGEDK